MALAIKAEELYNTFHSGWWRKKEKLVDAEGTFLKL
jgi:hypothetical protein